MKTELLVKTLLEVKDAYYNDTPTMTDAEFDTLEDELRSIDPENEYFSIVGAVNSKAKVTHNIPMLSAAKGKTLEDMTAWLKKINALNEKIMVQPKVDGLSANVIYEDGKLTMVSTRGDGKIGQDITHVSRYISMPQTIDLKNRIEIRGEIHLQKDTKFPNPKNKPLRNMAAGLVGRKDSGLEDLKHLHFVAYQVWGSNYKTEDAKMDWLERHKFETVWNQVIDIFQLQSTFDKYLKTFRSEWTYETDGLMLTINDNTQWGAIDSKYVVEHHHHYNIAWKAPSEAKETVLKDIEWNVTRLGRLIPVAIVEPVVLGGARVTRCTLNNYENVINLKLGKGNRVEIKRANDVIPFFSKNLDKGKPPIPKQCPSCKSLLQVEGIHLVCNNSLCEEQAVLKIIHWCEAREMEFFSESSIRALFNAHKIKYIRDLYNLTESSFKSLEGFGSKKISNALDQIEKTKTMDIGEFVDGLGIDLCGEKAIAKLGIKTAKDLLSFNDSTFVIGQNIMEYVRKNRAFVEGILSVVKITQKEVKMGAKKVCMTGAGPKTRNELIDDIEAKGDVFVSSVTKDTQILVCEDVTGDSSKLQKARKQGVKLMSYEEYFE
jgi:DNA ligase (NAD+)